MQRDDQTREQWTLPPDRPFEHIAESISPEEIRAMASLGGLERDTTFHFSLGCTFAKIRTRQHLLSAVGEFEHAIELTEDPERIWLAYLNKADVLSALGEYKDAIAAASSALEVLPGLRSYNKRQLLRLISGANLHLGNRDAALEAAVKAWESAPNDEHVAFNLIFTAHRTGNYSETVRIIRSALDSANGAQFLGRIIICMSPLRYTTEYMSIACEKVGDLEVARDAFQAVKSEAAVYNDKYTMAAADAALAQLYFGFYRDDDKAIALWEDIVRDYPNTMPAFDASFALMPLYFSKAQNADPTEARTWVSKMEQLVDLIEPMCPDPEQFPTQYEAAALLGRWYADQGELEQARAKIHPFVKKSIRDLTDRDNSNDYHAYNNLARALLCFGDRQNAAIAWAFTKPLRSVQELTEEGLQSIADWDMTSAPTVQAVFGTIPVFNFGGRCDGGCDRREATFKSFSICEICVDVTFCDECHQKLMGGTATFKICNPKHPLFEIYPPRGLVTKGAEGYKVHLNEEKVVSANEWLGMISREWGGS
jgi:tetratricopeptide (TPR) repeat protein